MRQKGFVPILTLIIGVMIGVVVVMAAYPYLKSKLFPRPTTLASPETNTSTPPRIANFDKAKLEKYLTVEAALLGVDNDLSLYFKDLNASQEIGFNQNRSWIPASTIKAFVVLEAFKQRDSGSISFDQQVTIAPQNVVPTELETDDYPRLREGTQATVSQLLGAMITQSDNTAYNTLLDILDRRNINSTLRSLGLTETIVGEKLNLDESQAAQDLQIPGRQPNTTTAKDLASLFDLLYSKKLQDADEILAIFKKQKINNMIPAQLPSSIEVAHKTGDWAPIYHDGGVVFKPSQPFILTVFTNDNDPSVIAKLARVAYFQTADSVGQDLPNSAPKAAPGARSMLHTYLAQRPSDLQVLAETSDTIKTPDITAEDLGVKIQDLHIDSQDSQKIAFAWITPKSILYGLKRFFENLQTSDTTTTNNQVKAQLSLSTDRLGEVKTLLAQGDVSSTQKVLQESEQDMKKAVEVATSNPGADVELSRVKQLNDLHFAALAEAAKGVKAGQKEQFVDMVYDFYQKNRQEVKSVVKASVIANPLQQQPVIGTVKEVKSDSATIQFSDGTQKQVVVSNLTPTRDFHNQTLDQATTLAPGSKIAIVGQTTADGKIVPQFILRNVPQQLPDKQEGVVVEIDSQKNILKIQNKAGQDQEVKVGTDTVLKAKDTSVSLEGIQVGSKVSVFGEPVNPPGGSSIPSPTGSLLPIPSGQKGKFPVSSGFGNPGLSPAPTPKLPINSNAPSSNSKTPAVNKSAPTNPPAPSVIKANTVTVTQNSSGSKESKKEPTKELKKEDQKRSKDHR